MAERSFIEIWSLGFDEIAWAEGFNRRGRIWAAFRLRFFRQYGRFPGRDGDVDEDSLRVPLQISARLKSRLQSGHTYPARSANC